MKKMTLVKGLALSSLLSFGAAKADTFENKIKTVNLQQLAMESNEGKEVMASLQKFQATLEAELKQLAMEIQRLDEEQKKVRSDIAKTKVAASPAAQADAEKKVRDIEYKKGELQAKAQRLMQDGSNDLRMEEMKLTQPLLADLVEVISTWAKEKDLSLVVDEMSGRVIFKKDGLDATGDIMKLANKKSEQKSVLAKNKAVKAPTTKVA